jgi:two-component system sensor histidine kinase ChvG
VRLSRARGAAELEVADDGPGVEPAMIERIFDRYVSTRATDPRRNDSDGKKPAGVNFGIGLWLVRRNVEAMGGTVVAENKPTHGLVMRVRLPLAA